MWTDHCLRREKGREREIGGWWKCSYYVKIYYLLIFKSVIEYGCKLIFWCVCVYFFSMCVCICFVCVCICMCVYLFCVCLYVCVFGWVFMCVCVCVFVCVFSSFDSLLIISFLFLMWKINVFLHHSLTELEKVIYNCSYQYYHLWCHCVHSDF